MNELALARFVPMRMKRRGVEMRLIIDGDAGPAARIDPQLLKAISRAYRWSNDLVSGRVRSIADIARREDLTPATCGVSCGWRFWRPGSSRRSPKATSLRTLPPSQ